MKKEFFKTHCFLFIFFPIHLTSFVALFPDFHFCWFSSFCFAFVIFFLTSQIKLHFILLTQNQNNSQPLNFNPKFHPMWAVNHRSADWYWTSRSQTLTLNFLSTKSQSLSMNECCYWSAPSSSSLDLCLCNPYMAAPRNLVGDAGRLLRDEESAKEDDWSAGKKPKSERFPLTRWEFAAALGVFVVFSTGLICVYLTMPAAEYGKLKLPRTIADLRLLKYVPHFHALQLNHYSLGFLLRVMRFCLG